MTQGYSLELSRMIRILSGSVLLLLLLPLPLRSQGLFPLAAGDIAGAAITRTDNYDQQGLFTYLSGGGSDLCIELGFGSLLVQEISFPDDRLKLEVYGMNSPEAAFGLYSLSTVQCIVRDTMNPYDCTSRYQYQTAYGNLYINITSETGSEFAIRQYCPLAQKVMTKNPGKSLRLPEPFDTPRMKASRKNLIFAEGPIGVQNSLFPWQDLFIGINFSMYSIILPAPVADIYFARISFPTPRDLSLFLGFAGLMQGVVPRPNFTNSDGLYREFQQVKPDDPLSIYFLQSQEPYPVYSLLNSGR